MPFHRGANVRKGHEHSFAKIGSAAHNALGSFICLCINEPQLISIGMFAEREHFANAASHQKFALLLHFLHFGNRKTETTRNDLRIRLDPLYEIAEPLEREFHGMMVPEFT